MAYPMFIYSIVLIILLNSSINATKSNFLKARDIDGKPFIDGIGVVSPGESITIECQHSESMSWSRTSLSTQVSEKLSSNGDKIIINKNELTIKNINFTDAAVYYCEKAGESYSFFLNVYAITKNVSGIVSTSSFPFEMNEIKVYQLKINEKLSANVSCTCDAGIKSTTVTINWKGGLYSNKISDEYSIDSKQYGTAVINTLVLRKPKIDRRLYGEYVCSCNAVSLYSCNALKEKKVYLEVPPIFEEHESLISTIEGLNVTLICDVWGYPLITVPIQWRFQNSTEFRDGIKVIRNKTHPGITKLFIPKVTQKDRGVYTCHAENSLGSNVAATMIRVKDGVRARDSKGKLLPKGPVVISYGESITLECNYNGTMSWSRRNKFSSKSESLTSNKNIIINQNKLTINNVDSEDTSIYYCENEEFIQKLSVKVDSNIINKKIKKFINSNLFHELGPNIKSFKANFLLLKIQQQLDKTLLLEMGKKSIQQNKEINKFILIKNKIENQLKKQNEKIDIFQKEINDQSIKIKKELQLKEANDQYIRLKRELQLREVNKSQNGLNNQFVQLKKELLDKSDQIKQVNQSQNQLLNKIIQIKEKLESKLLEQKDELNSFQNNFNNKFQQIKQIYIQKSFDQRIPFQNSLIVLSVDMDYTNALLNCHFHGMHLIKIQDDATNKMIFNFAILYSLKDFWIFGRYNRRRGAWMYSDEKTLRYTKWYFGQPDDAGKRENCINGNFRKTEYWNDEECTIERPVICYRET